MSERETMQQPLRQVLRSQRTLLVAVAAAYLLLSGVYAGLGYLQAPGSRIAPMDSAYYYMYLPSVWLDGDLDFSDEVSRLIGPQEVERLRTPLGEAGNPFPVGPALLWSPGFLLAHGVTLAANAMGAELPDRGFGPQYQATVYILDSLYGALGLLLLALLLCRFTQRGPALVAVLTVLLSTQLSYYLWSHTAMSHAPSFFAVALFFFTYLRHGVDVRTVLAVGLMFLVRWQDVLFALPLAVDCLAALGPALRQGGREAGRWALRMLGYACLFLLLCLPQMLVWNALYGSPVTVPTTQQTIDLLQLHPLRTLFSLSDGLFTWHPVTFAGLAGLLLLFAQHRGLAWKVWLAVLAQLVFISALQDSSGGSFGMRFFTGGLVFVALGLALLLQKLWNRRLALAALCSLLLLLAVNNQLLVYQFQHGLVPHARPLTYKHLVTDKFRLGAVREAQQHYLMGRQRFMAGDMAGFHSRMLRANSLDSGNERLLLGLGLSSLVVQDIPNARKAFSRLHELSPDVQLYILPLAAMALADGEQAADGPLLQKLDARTRERLRQRMAAKEPLLGGDFRERIFRRLSELQY